MTRSFSPRLALAAVALGAWCAPLAAQAPAAGAGRPAGADTLRLADLHAAALAHDPRGAQARLIAEQGALRLRNVRAERLPTLGLTGQAQHQSDVTSVPLPGALQPYKDTYDANVAARLRLFDPSRAARADVERAATAEGEARLASALHVQRQAVNDAFFTALLLDARRQVLAAAIAEVQAQLRQARERVAAGAALRSEAALLEAAELTRRQELDDAETGRAVALQMLGDLTGRALAGTEVLEAPAPVAVPSAAAFDTLRTRPEFTQFARSRALVDARGATVDAQDRPRVAAFGRTGYGRPGLNALAREFDSYWLAGVQVEWAPWDWGTARREREALVLQREAITTEERAFADRLRRAALADEAAIARLERALAQDDAIVALRARVLDETRARLGEGVITAAEFIDRETDLTQARLAHEARRVELAQARARLLTTAGLEVR